MELEAPNPGVFTTIFEGLDASDDPNQLNFRHTVFRNASKGIIAARDYNGRAHLLIPLGEAGAVTLNSQVTEGLRLRTITAVDGSTLLDFECLASQSDDIFGVICNAVCTSIHTAGNMDLGQVEMVLDAEISRWKAILASLVQKSPTRSEVVGLIGELLVLNALTTKKGVAALASWYGPDRARHDFESASSALEVKSTLSVNSETVQLHGTHQLEASDGTDLNLVLIRLERADGCHTVRSLVESLLMAGVRRDLLAQKLANFLPDGLAEFPEWAKLHSFKVNKINLYKVDETFPTPRLEALGADVAARISNFSCTLSLVGLATEEMTLNQFTSRIEEILR